MPLCVVIGKNKNELLFFRVLHRRDNRHSESYPIPQVANSHFPAYGIAYQASLQINQGTTAVTRVQSSVRLYYLLDQPADCDSNLPGKQVIAIAQADGRQAGTYCQNS